MPESRDLPEFENPPVTEVVLAVQFEPLRAFEPVHFGLLWARFRNRYPKTEQHPPLDPVLEHFQRSTRYQPRIELLTAPPIPRCWFLNDGGTELIQIQNDRFIHNWRKVGDRDTYPRYEHIRDQFQQELGEFQNFIKAENLGQIKANQCEVTYLNRIGTDSIWSTHTDAHQIVTVLANEYSDDFLDHPENTRFSTQYVLKNNDGSPVGRLHVSMTPTYMPDTEEPSFSLSLTARRFPIDGSIDGIIRTLDFGRNHIVRGFTSITTPQMHAVWRRQR